MKSNVLNGNIGDMTINNNNYRKVINTTLHQQLVLMSLKPKEEIGMEIEWRGEGVDEKGFDASGNCIVEVDPRYFRPTEVETLLGDPSKAKQKLGWEPKTTLEELCQMMVDADVRRNNNGASF